MANYEELYNTARIRYNQSVESLNNTIRSRNELVGQRNSIVNNLNNKIGDLNNINYNIWIVQNAENKCRSIIDNDFPKVKSSISKTSEEYSKIFSSDRGVANIENIYSSDLTNTRNDLNSVLTDLAQKRRKLESQKESIERDVNSYNNQLNSVNRQLVNTNIDYLRRVTDCYFTQMSDYRRRWLNSC